MTLNEAHTEARDIAVLVVDDAPENIDILTPILRPNYLVRVATGGEKALKIIFSDNPPDLVLLDVCMPGIDGFEVCRQIKSHPDRKRIPVIFITAREEQADEEFGLSLGAEDYIVKPFHASIVLARVRTHLALYAKARALEQQILSGNRLNTELQATLQQLVAAKGKLARAERLAAIGALVAGIAHELNTPIGSGLVAATVLEERSKQLEAQIATGIRRSDLQAHLAMASEATALIVGNLHKASNLIDKFKRLSVKETRSAASRFDLVHFMKTHIEVLAPSLANKSVTLAIAAPPALEITSHPEVLQEVLGHLIQNAVLHGFDQQSTGEIQIVCEEEGNGVVTIACVDNGCGIADAHVDRIFEPFFTTRMGTGSNGLGLNIVHNLVVDVLEGSISVASQPGRTQFLVRMPRHATPETPL